MLHWLNSHGLQLFLVATLIITTGCGDNSDKPSNNCLSENADRQCVSCQPNFFGAACTSICAQGKCEGTVTCAQADGSDRVCEACTPGYWGIDCSTLCGQVNCTGTVACTQADGSQRTCETCSPGYWGTDCTTPCEQGNCASIVTCLQTDGSERSCETCNTGYYGFDCTDTCKRSNSTEATATLLVPRGDPFPSLSISSLQVRQGHLFFRSSKTVYECSLEGCGNAPLTTMIPNVLYNLPVVWVNQDQIFWTQFSDGIVGYCNRASDECGHFAKDQLNVIDIAVDATHVYWAAFHERTIRRCPRTGCDEPELVAGPLPWNTYSLTLSGDHVYWTTTRFVYSCPKQANCTPKKLSPDAGFPSSLRGVNVADGFVYWRDRPFTPQDSFDGNIQRCPIAGCDGEPQILTPDIPGPQSIAVDGCDIYWRNAGVLYRCPVSGCTDAPEEVVSDEDEHVYDFTLAGDYIYWTGKAGIMQQHK